MAYMNQETKKRIAEAIKPILAKYGVKATLSVNNHSTLLLNVAASGIDFLGQYNTQKLQEAERKGRPDWFTDSTHIQVSNHWISETFTGIACDFLTECFEVLNNGNHDNSDITTDYFEVGWYSYINIGQWNKPYTLAH